LDIDKLKQWMNLAQQFHGTDFWNDIFQEENGKSFFNNANPQANVSSTETGKTFPRIDIFQNERKYLVVIDLPGLDKQDIQLSTLGDKLIIKGQVKSYNPDIERVHSERFAGPFERSIQINEPFDNKAIAAKFNNGLLEITLPKVQRAIHNVTIK